MKRSRAELGRSSPSGPAPYPLPEIDSRPNSPATSLSGRSRSREGDTEEENESKKKRFTTRELERKRHTLPVLDHISYIELQLEQRLKARKRETCKQQYEVPPSRASYEVGFDSTDYRAEADGDGPIKKKKKNNNYDPDEVSNNGDIPADQSVYIQPADEKLYARFPRFSSCLDIREISNSELRSMTWILNIIEGVYDSMEISLKAEKPLKVPFPFSAFNYISTVFGDYKLSSRSCWDIIVSLDYFLRSDYQPKDKSRILDLRIFAEFLRELHDDDVIFLFLYVRMILKKVLEIDLHRQDKTQTLELSDKGVSFIQDLILPDDVTISPSACQQVLCELFCSLKLEDDSADLSKYIYEELIIKNEKPRYLRVTEFLNRLLLNYLKTPEEIIRQLKYGDDGNRMHVLGRLQATLSGSEEKDKLLKQLQMEKLEYDSCQNKVKFLENKCAMSEENKEKYKVELFISKSDAWRAEQKVNATQKKLTLVDGQVESTWKEIIENDKASQKLTPKKQTTNKKYIYMNRAVPATELPNVSLIRFVKWIEIQFRKHGLKRKTIAQLHNLSWKEQLKAKRRKAALLIQRRFRERQKLRAEESKAKEELEKRKAQRRRQKRIEKQILARHEKEKVVHANRMQSKLEKEKQEKEGVKRRQEKIVTRHRHKEAERRMQKYLRNLLQRCIDQWKILLRLSSLTRSRERKILKNYCSTWKRFLSYCKWLKAHQSKAATQIQRIARGRIGRRKFKIILNNKLSQEEKIRINIMKMLNTHAVRCLKSWHIYVDKCKQAKLMFGRVMKSLQYRMFLEWIRFIKIIRQEKLEASIKLQCAFRKRRSKRRYNQMKREWSSCITIQSFWRACLCKMIAQLARKQKAEQEAKLGKFLKRIRFKTSYKVFRAFATHARQMIRVKQMFANQMSGLLKRSFISWIDWYDDRVELKRQAATTIQNTFRVKRAQAFVSEELRLRRAAVLIQRTHRGNLARSKVEVLYWNVQSAKHIQRVWRGFCGRKDFTKALRDFIINHMEEEYYPTIRAAFDKGYCKNIIDPETGDTLLHKACLVGSKRLVKLCLRHEVDIRAQNFDGETCLHSLLELSFFGQVDLIDYLLSKGAESKQADNEGMTPLMQAAESGNLEALKYLIPYSDVDAKEKINGNTAFHLACLSNRHEIVERLMDPIRGGSNVLCTDNEGATPLHDLAARGMIRMMASIMPKYENLDIVDNRGDTPLHYAVAEKRMKAIELLLDWGATPSPKDELSRTPLWYAAANGDLEILDYLCKRDSTVDDKCKRTGNTALHHACRNGQDETVRHLLAEGADHGIQNVDGDQPVHLAIKYMHISVLKLLIKYSCNMNIKNYKNRTPLGEARLLASKEISQNIVELIHSKYIERSHEEMQKIHEQRKAAAAIALLGRQKMMSLAKTGQDEGIISRYEMKGDSVENDEVATKDKSFLSNNEWNLLRLQYSTLELELGILLDSPWHRFSVTGKSVEEEEEEEEEEDEEEKAQDDQTVRLLDEKVVSLQGSKFWYNTHSKKYQWETPPELADLPESADSWTQEWDEEHKRVVFVNEKTGERKIDTSVPPPAKGGKYLEKRIKSRAKKVEVQEEKSEDQIDIDDDDDLSDEGGMNADEYRKYWEEENAEMQLKLLRERSALIIQVEYRRHASALRAWRARVLRDCAIRLQTRWRIVKARREKARKVKELHYAKFLQRVWRGARTRKWFREQKDILIEEKRRAFASAVINRYWRGYIGRRRFRRTFARECYPAPMDYDEWLEVRGSSEKLREFGVWDEFRYKWPDVLLYSNRFTKVCRWEKPAELIQHDMQVFNDLWKIIKDGFTKKEESCAILLQNAYRAKRMRKQFSILLKGMRIMKNAEQEYLNHPYLLETSETDHKGIVNLCNYMVYLSVIEHKYDRARPLYAKALEFMKVRGPDNAFILYSYSIFAAANCEEEYEDILDYVERARKADPTGKSFQNAEAGFYRQATIENPKHGRTLLNYALCLQFYGTCTTRETYIAPDLDQAETYYIRAVEADPYDRQIVDNFNFMLHSLKGVEYDAFDCFRMHQEKEIALEENKKLKAYAELLEKNAAVMLQKAFRGFLARRDTKKAQSSDIVHSSEHIEKKEGEFEQETSNKSPVWQQFMDEDGYIFYFNTETGESQWETPDDYIEVSQIEYVMCETPEGDVFYFNPVTEESIWELPDGASVRDSAKTQISEWEQLIDEEGIVYFYNHNTGESQWEAPDEFYKVGVFVHALFNEMEHWYPGRIEKVNGDGTYAISYDDGDYEESVKFENIAAREEPDLDIGSYVKVYQDDSVFLSGQVIGKGLKGYTVLYDSGEEEVHVQRFRIHTLLEAGQAESNADDWEQLSNQDVGLTYYRNKSLNLTQWNKPLCWENVNSDEERFGLEDLQLKALNDLFTMMDADGNGVLDRHEMIHVLQTNETCQSMLESNKGLHVLLDESRASMAYGAMDIHGRGTVTCQEFSTICIEILREQTRLLDIKNLFQMLSHGGDTLEKEQISLLLSDPYLIDFVRSMPSLSGLLRPRTFSSISDILYESVDEFDFIAACTQAMEQADRLAASARLHRLVHDNEGYINMDYIASTIPTLRCLTNNAELQELILNIDTSNKSRFISKCEHAIRRECLRSEAVRFFRLIDADASQSIDKKELQEAFFTNDQLKLFARARPGLQKLLDPKTFEEIFEKLADGTKSINVDSFIEAVI